jgi:Trk K+ transport system NAD-binding subunit
MREITIAENSKAAGKRIVELSIPATTNILSIKRAGVYISPIGSTTIMANDVLYVLAEDKHSLELLGQSLDIII